MQVQILSTCVTAESLSNSLSKMLDQDTVTLTVFDIFLLKGRSIGTASERVKSLWSL